MGADNHARVMRTIDDALRWGDEWVTAYVELHERAEELEHKAYMLEVRSVILEAEALLLRYDVAEALRKVPAA